MLSPRFLLSPVEHRLRDRCMCSSQRFPRCSAVWTVHQRLIELLIRTMGWLSLVTHHPLLHPRRILASIVDSSGRKWCWVLPDCFAKKSRSDVPKT
ncbi:uncharacterized protein J3R85_006532 [Psidium guajava]|nr:uncharacterized protein J3R85_006532 [Psidium guajava]